MKLIRVFAAVLVAGLTLATQGVHAQATSQFKVNLTLTPKCYVNIDTTGPSSQATTDVTMTYAAFQTTDEKQSTGFNVRCTTNWPYSIAVSPETDSVAGITYYLKLVAGGTASYTNTTGGGSLGSLTGSGADQAYSVGVQANAGQAGDCATAAACTGFKTHTVTVTY